MPEKQHENDLGADLYAAGMRWAVNEYGVEQIIFETGVCLELPPYLGGYIFPRSSSSKGNLRLANSVGVIDPGYRGRLKVVFDIPEDCVSNYQIGDRIAQLVILPAPIIRYNRVFDPLPETERGEGGFGSTGKS